MFLTVQQCEVFELGTLCGQLRQLMGAEERFVFGLLSYGEVFGSYIGIVSRKGHTVERHILFIGVGLM